MVKALKLNYIGYSYYYIKRTQKVIAKHYVLFSIVYLFRNMLHNEIINYCRKNVAIYLYQQSGFKIVFLCENMCVVSLI